MYIRFTIVPLQEKKDISQLLTLNKLDINEKGS